jgi:hypothetical protein
LLHIFGNNPLRFTRVDIRPILEEWLALGENRDLHWYHFKKKTSVGVGSLILVVAAGSGYLKKKSKSKNHQVWVFKKLERIVKFHERRNKDPTIF